MGGVVPSQARMLATIRVEATEVATTAEKMVTYREIAQSQEKAEEEATEVTVAEEVVAVTDLATIAMVLATLHASAPSQGVKGTIKTVVTPSEAEAVEEAVVHFKRDRATTAKRLATCLATAQSHARNAALMTIPDLAAEEVAAMIIVTVSVTIAAKADTCHASAQLRVKIKATGHVVVEDAPAMVVVKRVT